MGEWMYMYKTTAHAWSSVRFGGSLCVYLPFSGYLPWDAGGNPPPQQLLSSEREKMAAGKATEINIQMACKKYVYYSNLFHPPIL